MWVPNLVRIEILAAVAQSASSHIINEVKTDCRLLLDRYYSLDSRGNTIGQGTFGKVKLGRHVLTEENVR